MKYAQFTWLPLLVILLAACGPDSDTDNGPGAQPGDFHAPGNENNTSQVVDSAALREIDPGAAAASFNERHKRFLEALFAADFESTETDDTDLRPVFPGQKQGLFFKYRRKEPINNAYAKGVIPRFVFKAYEFPDAATLKSEVEAWLSGMDSSDEDQIELGEHVDALKTPTFLCAVRDNEMYLLASACIYSGTEWEAFTENFVQVFSEAESNYVFMAGCNAGEVTYWVGGTK